MGPTNFLSGKVEGQRYFVSKLFFFFSLNPMARYTVCGKKEGGGETKNSEGRLRTILYDKRDDLIFPL
jgi:hypothetical protein